MRSLAGAVTAALVVATAVVVTSGTTSAQAEPAPPAMGHAIIATGTKGRVVEWNGQSSTALGPVAAGGDISLSGSGTIDGSVTYGGRYRQSGSWNTATPPVLGQTPTVSDTSGDYAPGGPLADLWTGNGRWFDHSDDCVGGTWGLYGSQVDFETGVHWVPCAVQVAAQRVTGSATIVATGRIAFYVDTLSLHPAPGERNSLVSAATGSAIEVGADGVTVSGAVLAANGTITLNGSGSSFGCGLWAQQVRIYGSDVRVDGNGPGCAEAGSLDPACMVADPAAALGLPGTVLLGTPGDDTIVGTPADEVICALAGDDTIDGGGGNDVVFAGSGNDIVTTGDGDDRVDLGAGDDTASTGAGRDRIDAVEGHDRVDAGPGDDRLYGHSGDDELVGGDGDDHLDGGAGHDAADGGPGTDSCVNSEVETSCEVDIDALDPLVQGVLSDVPAPGPLTFSRSNDALGVDLVVDSAGGLTTLDVDIAPAYRYWVQPMEPVLASLPVDITIPSDAPPINGASLTLAYDVDRLDGFDPALLRIYNYDPAIGLWLPVPGAQTVDAVAGTVTAQLEHFSVYAVLKIAQSSDWAQVFTQLPLRCVDGPGGGTTRLDVAFVIDQSGSMNTYDPLDRRVDAARAFLDVMDSDDRATVIGFTTSAIDRAALLDVGTNRTTLEAAIDATGAAGGGTAFTPPMRLAINRLAAAASPDRLRVIILLTDGQGSYDTSLTGQAAGAGIEVYTVGLGPSVDANLLTAIAEGTGGTYQPLATADELPELYRQLAEDLTQNRADDDDDLIPDCVERNGAFVPQRNIDYGTGTAFSLGPSFITTVEPKRDTDEDGLIDGIELQARQFDDNPYLAEEYSYLVDQGLEEYYYFLSDPNSPDTDGDGIDDRTEILNGLEPTTYDIGVETDIASLDYPPFTLFRLAGRDELDPFRRMNFEFVGDQVRFYEVVYTQTPVEFQIDGDCYSNCDPLIARAEEWGNGNGNGICINGWGDCVTDEGQIRTLVREAIRAQGIFTEDGRKVTAQFVYDQSLLLCAYWTGDLAGCTENLEQLDIGDVDVDDRTAAINSAAVIAIPVNAPTGTGVRINPAWVGAAAATAVAVGAVVAIPKTQEVTEADVATLVAACAAQAELLKSLIPTRINRHPCEVIPMYFPGADIGASLGVRQRALAQDPSRILQQYSSREETESRGIPRRWFEGLPGCSDAEVAAAQVKYGAETLLTCDEFPNYSMQNAGPGAYIEWAPFADNSLEGSRYGTFVNAPGCKESVKLRPYAQRAQFAVIPVGLPATLFTCGLRPGGG